jgi:rRNA-processing protein FCF1
MKRIVICDANILIDYAKANKKIIGLVTEHLYEVWVPLPVWEEIEDLSNKEGKDLGLNIIEPSLAQAYEAANMYGGGLSDEDNMCFIMARDEKAICATNEKPLRRKCKDNGIDVLWGLQIIIQLCEIGKLKADSAAKTGEKIAKMNPRITQKVLDDFIDKLDNI